MWMHARQRLITSNSCYCVCAPDICIRSPHFPCGSPLIFGTWMRLLNTVGCECSPTGFCSCMQWCGSPFRAQGMRINVTKSGRYYNNQLQPATLHWSASCNILSQRHPIHQGIVLPCQLQDSMPMPVSATNCHPRPRHTEQILNIQVCTCLTTVRRKKKLSTAFVPQHVCSCKMECHG